MRRQILVAVVLVCALFSAVIAQDRPTTAPANDAARPVAVQVGAKSFNIPVPEGFVDASAAAPDTYKGFELVTPPSNRLLAGFIEPAAVHAPAGTLLNRYILVQTLRAGENISVTDEQFRMIKDQTAKQMDQMAAEAREQTNERMKQLAAGDEAAAVKIGEMIMLGTFSNRENSMGFCMLASVQAADGKGGTIEQTQVCAATILKIDNKLMYLYVNTRFDGEKSLEWAKSQSLAWTEEILKQR